MKTTIYYRVSTDAQDEQSQRAQVADYLGPDRFHTADALTDTASGSTPWQARKLAAALAASAAGDSIIVSEISRIARSTVGVLTFLQAAAEKGITVIAVRNKLALDDSLHSKITVTVLALAAEIERDLLRERTKAALAARRAAGKKLGRPHGSRSPSIIADRADEIQRALDAKISKRGICRMLNCSPGTLYAFLESRQPATIDPHTLPLPI